MEFFIGLFRSHVTLASSFLQYIVYITSALVFFYGLWASLRAFRWLRRVDLSDLKKKVDDATYADDPLMLVVAKTYRSAIQKSDGSFPQPAFVADATRQMAENLFENRYMDSITMSSNLLPPLGFIGTVFGMILIFLAKVNPSGELNTIGLGTALFTTLVALLLFVVLEIIKMWLFHLVRQRVTSGINFTMEVDD